MTFKFHSADASDRYRETSAISSVRFDGTANTGSLFELMKDNIISFASRHNDPDHNQRVPVSATGDISAIARPY